MKTRRKPRNREKRRRKGCYPNEFYAPPLGEPLGVHDCEGQELHIGDLIEIYVSGTCPRYERGRILERCKDEALMFLDYSMWYFPYDEFDPGSYGKKGWFKLDGGERMNIRRLELWTSNKRR